MGNCATARRLCNHLVISTSVTFTNDTLVINIPQAAYNNYEKYCIVVAQSIPDTATINAPVVITIGTDLTTTYPLLNCDGTPVLASSINSRTRYSTYVRTTTTSGSFILTGRLPCTRCINNLPSIPAPTA